MEESVKVKRVKNTNNSPMTSLDLKQYLLSLEIFLFKASYWL